VDTPDGAGVLEKIYLTELGHVMGKVYFPSKKVWVNYQLASIDNLLNIKQKIGTTFKIAKFNRRRKKLESVLQN
jgi:hypothetical protein